MATRKRGGAKREPKSPPDEFRSFMVALATDPAKLGSFIKDPDGTMQAAGISDADQMILKSGQPWAIHGRLSGQKYTLTPPSPGTPVTVLVVDMTKPPGADQAATADEPAVRAQPAFTPPSQGSVAMFPNFPQIFPQVHPQVVVHPQIWPQVHPQVVVHPQIWPQIHPQIVHPQVVVHPQIWPQIHPQILPQLVTPGMPGTTG